jgi:two-component system LytT family sensor kinase
MSITIVKLRDYVKPFRIEVRKHVLVWLLITLYFGLTDPVSGTRVSNLITVLTLTGNLILLFYTVIFVLMPIVYEKKYLLASLSFIMVYAIFAFFDYLNFNFLMPSLGISEFKGTYSEIAHNSYRMYIAVCGVGVGYYINDISIRKMHSHHQSEKALMTKELNFLRSQFNSHITFNFLTYCYSKVHNMSEETADAIETFSQMLRYTLIGKTEVPVPLEKEIEYISNFIQLQKLLSQRVFVTFNLFGNASGKNVMQGILIPFVENAFSHGEYSMPEHPIDIRLSINCESISLNVYNRKRTSRRIGGTGIGLENVKQLLNIYYPNQYQLWIEDRVEDFECKLNLNLASDED